MSIEIKELIINKLQTTRQELLDITKKLNPEELKERINSHNSDAWTKEEVIRHLMISENGLTKLVEQIKHGGEGVPEDFDLTKYNKNSVMKLATKSIEETLETMSINRAKLLEVINELTVNDFSKKGRHATLRIMSIEQILHLIGDHEAQHMKNLV